MNRIATIMCCAVLPGLMCGALMLGCQPGATPASEPAASKPEPAEAAASKPAAKPAAKPTTPKAATEAAASTKAAAVPNTSGVTPAACEIVCDHILRLSLEALPPDVDPEVRAKHSAQLAQNCPAGCMKQATIASNNCVLRAKTALDAAACQP